MTDQPPPVYGDDGRIIYRASSFGGCLTMLAAARQGFERQGKALEKIAEAGEKAEDWVFSKYPQVAMNRQLPVYVPITKRIVVVAHVDALPLEGVVEIKSQSDRQFKDWTYSYWESDQLWRKYAWQISVEMIGAAEFLGAEKPGFIYRVNRDTGQIWFDGIPRPFHSKEEIVGRVLEVEALAMDDSLRCSTPDFFCPYPFLHPQLEPVEDDELEGLVADYLTLSGQVKEAGKIVGAVRSRILEKMDMSGYGERILLTSGRTVSRAVVEVKEHMVKASVQTRLTVSEAK